MSSSVQCVSCLDAEKAVPVIGRTGLADYVRVLRAWFRGHYDWCRVTRRYNAPLT
ncbi:hypothetical protein [Streptomyces lanatus]|uniref:Transposase n=1 Tax=Streptomyces lanatus TaxID=66900 RepID=A0ABV1XLH5_9ACTN|nr:hypothetical protein [Streptomyces lanatus]GHG99050.1 hypothetical protein GCM10018780_25440 [Streptomyces lanatus]